MKTLFQTSWKLAPVLLLMLVGTVMTTRAQSAKLQLDQLDPLANKASEAVDVRIDERLLQTTAKFFSGKDPDDADIREVLKGLKGIYVKSFSFEKDGEYSQAEVESVMSQLRVAGWSKIVGIVSKKAGENVAVYLNTAGDQINGLAVLSIDPREFTVVNIVGPIDLEKLSKLEGQFGVPDLGMEKPKAKKPE
jgi:biopolymer transport protein ExbD